jgi:radical S-adenosyl methionine domain-containing protein 2
MLSATIRRLSSTRLPLTANMHFLQACNFRCKFCFATFDDWTRVENRRILPHSDLMKLVNIVAKRYTKVTFAGGEPTLYPRLAEMLEAAKACGSLTNIVTNGSLLTTEWLARHGPLIDFVTLSIDSDNGATHRLLGRCEPGKPSVPTEFYLSAAENIRRRNIVLKLNSVVTTVNQDETITSFVKNMKPCRWKILQAMPIPGQNDLHIGELQPTAEKFRAYVARHEAELVGTGIRVVPEEIEDIRTSYIMIDPLGRFFDDVTGPYRYSRPILKVGIEAAWGDVYFNEVKFKARGGTADFAHAVCGPQ